MFLGASGILATSNRLPAQFWFMLGVAVGDRISQVDRAKSVVWSMLATAMQARRTRVTPTPPPQQQQQQQQHHHPHEYSHEQQNTQYTLSHTIDMIS